jgi:hypothetical protein
MEINYQFKKFEGRHSRQESRITLTKSYQIGFPTQFYKDNNVTAFKYVVLFWDEDNRTIGVNFTNNEQEKNRFTIVHNEKYGGSVACRSFLKSNSIDVLKYHGRCDYEKYNLEGVGELFIFKLKEADKK